MLSSHRECQDALLGSPQGAECKVTFGTPVPNAVESSAPSGRPIGAPLKILLVPRKPYSHRFVTGWFPQSLVKPSYAQAPASDQANSLFCKF